MSAEHVTMTARKATRCNRCGGPIQPGDAIVWQPAAGMAEHADCPEHDGDNDPDGWAPSDWGID